MKHPGKTSPAEFRATCIVILILIISIFLPGIYDRMFPSKTPSLPSITLVEVERDTILSKKWNSNKTKSPWQTRKPSPRRTTQQYKPVESRKKTTAPKINCTPFDPNSVSAETLVAMGVSGYVPENIEKYRTAGGVFRKAEDLGRIYGMDSITLSALLPCLEINHPNQGGSRAQSESYTFDGILDINAAGLEEWKALPGIGDVLADRIIRFRERLGGFHHVSQIAETYGLPPETYASLVGHLEVSEAPQLINVNQATIEELKSHPYITFRQARSIVTYRQHHGKFTDLQDLMAILSLSEDWLVQMTPYLTCNPAAQPADLAAR
jgi:DNA uptake protein ComE-like DNA-binding protein